MVTTYKIVKVSLSLNWKLDQSGFELKICKRAIKVMIIEKKLFLDTINKYTGESKVDFFLELLFQL